MIKRIKHIKYFGVFKDFRWSNPLQDFEEKNTIYGWNYSCKITLSRLFAVIKEKKVHPKLTVAGEGKDFSQNDMKDNDLEVRRLNLNVNSLR